MRSSVPLTSVEGNIMPAYNPLVSLLWHPEDWRTKLLLLFSYAPIRIPYVSSELFLLILLTKCNCQHCSVIAECIVILGTGLASYSAWVGS